MFGNAIKIVEDCLFGVNAYTNIPGGIKFNGGTAVAINDTQVLTCAHILYENSNFTGTRHTNFRVIKDSNLGSKFVNASLVAIDVSKDLSVLEITGISTNVIFDKNLPEQGIHVGSLGYPNNGLNQTTKSFDYYKRFKGSFVSCYLKQDKTVFTDQEMYPGTSGCPVFNIEGNVVGIHNRNENDPKNTSNRIDIAYNISIVEIRSFLDANSIVYTTN